MKNRPIVLQPTRQPPTHTTDHALDLAIAKHRGRMNSRLQSLAGNPHARAALARHFVNRVNHTPRGFRS